MNQPVAVVTGASSGLGRGIARALGSKGYTVYLTGRNQSELDKAATEVSVNGGSAIAVRCDHANDDEVQALFQRVEKESGHLDLLVNNAAAVYPRELASPAPYWEKPLCMADMINVGLRSNYVAAFYATPLLLKSSKALIVHTSFYGAVSYFHGPAYGAAKAGTDKMSFDMAIDLQPHNVASVTIWPGFILSDQLKNMPAEHLTPELAARLKSFEHPEFTGFVIDQLFRDPELMSFSGQSFIGAELGLRYQIKDLDGKQPSSYSSTMGSPNDRFIGPAQ